MASSVRGEHARSVSEQIDDLTKQFVTDWNFDNQDEKPLRNQVTPEDLPISPREPKLTPVEGNPFTAPRASLSQSAPPPGVGAGSSASWNEVVQVKYRGPVNLAAFTCEAIKRSSFIERVCYDAKNTYMLIDLSGTWYHYCEIDQGTVSSLLAAESMGHFFDTSIKGSFDCRTHRVPAYSVDKAPPCKDGSQTCKPWERDWSETEIAPGSTVMGEDRNSTSISLILKRQLLHHERRGQRNGQQFLPVRPGEPPQTR